MPPKKNKKKSTGKTEDPKKPPAFQKSAVLCSFHGPGPKYKLKPVVGYDDHCTSRFRNPAYSIAFKQTGEEAAHDGPGPIYYAEIPRTGGFTIGRSQRGEAVEGGPGPYMLPDPPRTPAFSLSWRTPLRGFTTSAGPYNVPNGLGGPAFTIASRPESGLPEGGPGPSRPYSIDPIKPRAPAYSIGFRQNDAGVSAGPGPYNPKNLDKSPAFSFGVKHSPCLPPLITECDEAC